MNQQQQAALLNEIIARGLPEKMECTPHQALEIFELFNVVSTMSLDAFEEEIRYFDNTLDLTIAIANINKYAFRGLIKYPDVQKKDQSIDYVFAAMAVIFTLGFGALLLIEIAKRVL